MPELTPAERRSLKARAHRLKPVVRTGEAGLSAAVMAEIDRQLTCHGLIKVRLTAADRKERAALAQALEAALGANLVQRIGRILVLFRPKPEGSPAPPGRRARQGPRFHPPASRGRRLPGKGATPQT
jgi:RNA-binding protein